MAFVITPHSDDEKIRGHVAWQFWRLMVDEGLLNDDLANPDNPVWRSARGFINKLPLLILSENVISLYNTWKITVLHASP